MTTHAIPVKESRHQQGPACRGTIEALVAALDARECETHRHSERVTLYTRFLAEQMGVRGADLHDIYYGALLHDIGKIGIPDAILLKPDSLTKAEWRIMKRHPQIGQQILSNVDFLKPAADIVLTHEERFDGTGYPQGLREGEIPQGARIFAVMDALDAMAFDRPYRKAMPYEQIMEEIRKGKGIQFDPEVVDAFMVYASTFEQWVTQDTTEQCEPHWQHTMTASLSGAQRSE